MLRNFVTYSDVQTELPAAHCRVVHLKYVHQHVVLFTQTLPGMRTGILVLHKI